MMNLNNKLQLSSDSDNQTMSVVSLRTSDPPQQESLRSEDENVSASPSLDTPFISIKLNDLGASKLGWTDGLGRKNSILKPKSAHYDKPKEERCICTIF